MLFTCSLVIFSCGYQYEHSPKYEAAYDKHRLQKSDTLTVIHSECTECSDLYIVEGTLSIPPGLKEAFSKSSLKDIKVCGNFPAAFLDVTAFDFKAGTQYKITGKVIMADTFNAIGAIPVFYTEHWSKLK